MTEVSKWNQSNINDMVIGCPYYGSRPVTFGATKAKLDRWKSYGLDATGLRESDIFEAHRALIGYSDPRRVLNHPHIGSHSDLYREARLCEWSRQARERNTWWNFVKDVKNPTC